MAIINEIQQRVASLTTPELEARREELENIQRKLAPSIRLRAVEDDGWLDFELDTIRFEIRDRRRKNLNPARAHR